MLWVLAVVGYRTVRGESEEEGRGGKEGYTGRQYVSTTGCDELIAGKVRKKRERRRGMERGRERENSPKGFMDERMDTSTESDLKKMKKRVRAMMKRAEIQRKRSRTRMRLTSRRRASSGVDGLFNGRSLRKKRKWRKMS